jgi:hypothetical protein
MELYQATTTERTTTMATEKITPTNPDTKVTDEVEDEEDAAERKTASVRIGGRRSNRKTPNMRFGG